MTTAESRDPSKLPCCSNCVFGRPVTVVVEGKDGKEKSRSEMCECHVSRPTRFGFPVIRPDDFCAWHVNATTLERTYAGLLPNAATFV